MVLHNRTVRLAHELAWLPLHNLSIILRLYASKAYRFSTRRPPTLGNIAVDPYRTSSQTLNIKRIWVATVTLWHTDWGRLRYEEEKNIMNRPPRLMPEMHEPVHIADVQGSEDSRQIPIDKVGIKGIRHPVRVRDRSGREQHTIATFNMYVDLPHHFKGTHMSRFVEILNHHEYEITVQSFKRMLFEMTELLEAKSGHVEMSFPYFVNKSAPVSGVQSLVDYEVSLIGKLHDNAPCMHVKVIVPVTSLCPCSKEISDYGAHNQRSHVTVGVRTRDFVWIEEIIDIVESEASCQLYGLLKRPDEKFVTEHAYDNPKFVEDMVRDVATRLNADERIEAYVVESENFESIHNHSAYAFIERDKSSKGHKGLGTKPFALC